MKSKAKLLDKAYKKWTELPEDVRKNLTGTYEKESGIYDEKGKIGILMGGAVLMAKESPATINGEVIVSINKDKWDRCKDLDKNLLIYIHSSDKLYLFFPRHITPSFVNQRDGVYMTNFGMSYGSVFPFDEDIF